MHKMISSAWPRRDVLKAGLGLCAGALAAFDRSARAQAPGADSSTAPHGSASGRSLQKLTDFMSWSA